jgi:tripartite-type tricarboxylate transporter receptor subunit TctC
VESGLRGYDVRLWLGLLAPAGTPREVVSRMHSEIVKRGKVIQQVGTFDN